MDSFFLSKSIEGEAEGAKECAPHSARPCMPPSCSCTLPFVCPLCAQSREGVGHRLRVGRAPRFACPLCAYTGDGAPLPCPRGLPFARRPCAQAGGRGRGFPVYARPRLHVALRAKRREGGAASGFAPCLSAWRTNGEGPAPLPHAPCSRAASAQKPRWGGVGLRAAPSLHGPFACNQGHAGSHSHTAARLCVTPAHKLGGGGPAALLLGLGVALARHHRVREGEGGAKGGGFLFPHSPVLATPSQSRAPPWFVHNQGVTIRTHPLLFSS